MSIPKTTGEIISDTIEKFNLAIADQKDKEVLISRVRAYGFDEQGKPRSIDELIMKVDAVHSQVLKFHERETRPVKEFFSDKRKNEIEVLNKFNSFVKENSELKYIDKRVLRGELLRLSDDQQTLIKFIVALSEETAPEKPELAKSVETDMSRSAPFLQAVVNEKDFELEEELAAPSESAVVQTGNTKRSGFLQGLADKVSGLFEKSNKTTRDPNEEL